MQSEGRRRSLEQCVSRVVALYPVEMWPLASSEGMGGQQALTPQRYSAGWSVYRQCVLGGAGVESNTTSNHNTDCMTSMAMHKATVQQSLTTVSPDSNPMSVFHRAIVGANARDFDLTVNAAMDALRTLHSAANDFEWYAR